jgi:hypothetical protein
MHGTAEPSDLTLTSTTADEATLVSDMAATRGAKAEPKPVEQAPEATAEPVAGDEKPEPTSEQSEAGRKLQAKKGSLQARIDELTFEKHANAREAAQAKEAAARLQTELDALKAKPAATEPAKVEAPAAAVAPKLDDFNTYDEFNRATIEWLADQKVAKIREEFRAEFDKRATADRQTAEQAEQAKQYERLRAEHDARIEATRAAHPDFDTVIESAKDVKVSPLMRVHLEQSEMGGELLYHFANHPEEAQRIAAIQGDRAYVELGKLEARLDAARLPGPAAIAPPKSETRPPIKPVGASSTTSTVGLDDLNADAFMSSRNRAQIEKRRAR